MLFVLTSLQKGISAKRFCLTKKKFNALKNVLRNKLKLAIGIICNICRLKIYNKRKLSIESSNDSDLVPSDSIYFVDLATKGKKDQKIEYIGMPI